MKLILGSDLSFLLKFGYDLTGIPKNKIKIGYITTAAKRIRTHHEFFKQVKRNIENEGYSLEEIDIEGKSETELRIFLKDKNIIQIEGGNTFYLLKAIRENSFDKILRELLNEGKIYIGTSAGSYIMCPSIEVSDWSDSTVDRCGVIDFTALNYVPFVLKVHYKDTEKEKVKDNMKNLKYPLHILRDGQGMFCEDGVCKFIGDDEEIKLD